VIFQDWWTIFEGCCLLLWKWRDALTQLKSTNAYAQSDEEKTKWRRLEEILKLQAQEIAQLQAAQKLHAAQQFLLTPSHMKKCGELRTFTVPSWQLE